MPIRLDNRRIIRAPRGQQLSAKSWVTEAPLRMLMNNLDPDVAEKPHELVVYGGSGCAARADREFEPRAALGNSRSFQRARSQGPDDVWADDCGVVDLYRLTGN